MTAKLDFIIGTAGTGKTAAVLQAMQEKCAAEPLGTPLILLTPEHMTYKLERELASRLKANGAGFMRAHVFGFRRFARQVLLETGGALPRISDVGRRLLLRRLLVTHSRAHDLSVFARAARQRGFTATLSDAIKELKSYRLDTALLRRAGEELGDTSSRLAGKLSELATLADEFGAAMAGRTSDAEDMMRLLAERLPGSRLMPGAEVWLDGFIFFNPQELAVVAALLQSAASVHITLPMAGASLADGRVNIALPENMAETGLFNRSYRTHAQLMRLLQELSPGAQSTVTLLTGNKRAATGSALALVERALFTRESVTSDDATGLRLVEAANPRLEVETVAADILRLVREEGYRYHDIGVLVRDGDSYNAAIELVFAGAGIPCYHDSHRPSVHHPLAELLRSALEVVARGWRYETVFRALRTGFFALVPEDIDRLENYVLEFGIRGRRRWTQAEPWSWHRRYALDDDGAAIDETTAERLAYIDGLRTQAMQPLAALEDAIRAAASVRELAAAVYEFFTALEVPQHLTDLMRIAEGEGRLADAAEHRQVWAAIVELLDQLVEVSGEDSMPLADFTAIVGDGLDALELALIPPGLDYVTIAAFDQNSLDNTRAIYILGANTGSMPRRTSEQGLFTDADRLHLDTVLKKIGGASLEISRGAAERSFGEKFLMYRAFTEAREYLWVSYALADGSGAGLTASPVVRRLQAIFPALTEVGESFISIPLETVERTDSLQLAAPRPALSGLAAALRGQRERGEMPEFWRDVYNWALGEESLRRPLTLALAGLFATARDSELPEELARAIYLRGKNIRGSVTQFESFHRCPFAHFAAYGLRLQERRSYQLGKNDLGQLLHEVLREYGECVKSDYAGRWQDVPEERRPELCRELVERIAPRLQSEILLSRSDYQHRIARIGQTAAQTVEQLTAWAALSEFQPAYLEEGFGHAGDRVDLAPLPLGDGYSLSFKGQIDRLDVQLDGSYFLIVDYKSGTAAINLFEVYYGLKLQLLVYAMVGRELLRQQGEERLPAGLLYSFLKNPVIGSDTRLAPEALQKKITDKLKMPGWVLADVEVIRAIDASQAHIKAKLNKNDTISKSAKNAVRTADEFALLLGYVDYILRDTGRRILAGEIAARPYRTRRGGSEQTACTYCRFGDVCGFDLAIEGFSYHDICEFDDETLERSMAGATGMEDIIDAIYGGSAKGD